MFKAMVEHPIQVLLVERHQFTRLGLRSALSNTPSIKVCAEADSADIALKLIAQSPADVAIIGADASLPAEGFELCRRLRIVRNDLRVIMLMPESGLNGVSSIVNHGAHAYALKNVNAERLMAAIISVFHGDTWIDAALAEWYFLELIRVNKAGGVGASAIRSDESSADGSGLLTQRETEVLSLIVQGLTNQAIADRLVVSLATAKAHVRSILCKLSVSHRTEAAVEAIRRGLV